ncbi:hypothetical protein AAVH_22793 [Aphelenchoides avenae]|nr:hypothetical protein AAVH_22793 [Aphelenchus avenae]
MLQLKIAFGVSWCINFALCLLITFVLIGACLAPTACTPKTTVSFCIFVALFLLLTVSLLLYRITRSSICFIMASVFAFEQFLCAVFVAFALFTNERSVPAVAFKEDPLLWVHVTRVP